MTIYITNNNIKKEILKNRDPFTQIKVYTFQELETLYPYKYDNHALDFLVQEYNIHLSIAKIYISIITKYPIEKINQPLLKEIKEKLIKEKLITKNNKIYEYLKAKKIIVTSTYNKDIETWLSPLKIEFQKLPENDFKPTIYELNNKEEEIAFVGEKIADLLKQGISPNHIYIGNIEDNYKSTVKRIFTLQNIPICMPNKNTIANAILGSNYLKGQLTKEEITLEETDIYNKIITIENKYIDLKSKNEFIKSDIENTPLKDENITNAITVVNIKEKQFTNEDYVFLMNYNKESIPTIYKDEELLSDQEKEILNLETTTIKNKKEKEELIQLIKNIPNCTITYKKLDNGKICYPSPILKELNKDINTNNSLEFNVSDNYNKLYLASSLDEFIKYNTISKELQKLEKLYAIPYRTYNNKFTNLKNENLKENIKLSYTSLDTYIKCPFNYYLTYILKLKPYEETFQIFIGNLYHSILENLNASDNWEDIYNEIIKNKEFTFKEQFFLEKLKNELSDIIKIIKEQDKHCALTETLTEKQIIIKMDENTNFEGKIDKIKYINENENTIIMVTDYKTGNSSFKQEYFPLGLNLQLPIYLYLIKESKIFKNPIIGGFYLQSISLNRLKNEENKSYELLKRNRLKLHGFSTDNEEILKLIDDTYANSENIAGLKMKNDKTFYQYSKVLNSNMEKEIYDLVDKIIKETVKNIKEGNFQIQAKIIDNEENVSCKYCPYECICNHEAKDNIYLNSDKKFLKKEDN